MYEKIAYKVVWLKGIGSSKPLKNNHLSLHRATGYTVNITRVSSSPYSVTGIQDDSTFSNSVDESIFRESVEW